MCRQFDSVLNHSSFLAVVAKWLTHRIVVPTFEGSIPFNRPIIVLHFTCGCSLMAKPQPSKLMLWVRFPSPAPFYLSTVAQWQSYRLLTDRSQVRVLPVEPWLLGQAVKTPPFHGGNTGSSPVGVIQTEVKYRFCFFIIIFYHGELSELAEGARLESVQASQASRGFESLTLRYLLIPR